MWSVLLTWSGRITRLGLAAYLMVLVLLMLFEEQLVFPAPKYPAGNWRPDHLAFEDVWFESADGTRLHGWYFPVAAGTLADFETQRESRGPILYCHGNAACVADLADYADELRAEHGRSVLIFDYRGYGRSEGRPSEDGVVADAVSALNWLCNRAGCDVGQVIVFGRSLGGGVAVALAAQFPVDRLVLQNTFSSIVDVAAQQYFWVPVRWLMRNRFDSTARITAYSGPVLQSHGTADEVVPYDLGLRLHEAIPGPKHFVSLAGLRHGSVEPPEYEHRLAAFLSGTSE